MTKYDFLGPAGFASLTDWAAVRTSQSALAGAPFLRLRFGGGSTRPRFVIVAERHRHECPSRGLRILTALLRPGLPSA